MSFDFVFYHKNCSDGTASLFAWEQSAPGHSAVVVPYQHGDSGYSNYDLKGKSVLCLDMCFPAEVLAYVLDQVAHLTILDHHKTTVESLDKIASTDDKTTIGDKMHTSDKITSAVDMTRSGCQITWDYFHTSPRPWFIDYIADRDLWTWKLPDSKKVNEALFAKRYITLLGLKNLYKDTADMSETELSKFIESLTDIGGLITDIKRQSVNKVVAAAATVKLTVDTTVYKVAFVCCPDHGLISEAGNEMAKNTEVDFACLWRYDFAADQWWLSFRGADNSTLDLTAVAKAIDPNGGGHPKACGASIYGAKNQNLRTFFSVL